MTLLNSRVVQFFRGFARLLEDTNEFAVIWPFGRSSSLITLPSFAFAMADA